MTAYHTCTTGSTLALAGFNDIDKATADQGKAIELLSSLSVMSGRTATEFDPAAGITRAEIAAVMFRLFTGGDESKGLFAPTGDIVDGAGNVVGKDVVENHWALPYLNWAVSQGVLKGVNEGGDLAPDKQITLAEVVTMVNRTLGYEEPKSAWPTGHIALGQRLGLFTGITNLLPNEVMSRANVAQMSATALYVEAPAFFTYDAKGEIIGRTAAKLIIKAFKADTVTGVLGGTSNVNATKNIDKSEQVSLSQFPMGNNVNGGTELVFDFDGNVDSIVGQKVEITFINKDKSTELTINNSSYASLGANDMVLSIVSAGAKVHTFTAKEVQGGTATDADKVSYKKDGTTTKLVLDSTAAATKYDGSLDLNLKVTGTFVSAFTSSGVSIKNDNEYVLIDNDNDGKIDTSAGSLDRAYVRTYDVRKVLSYDSNNKKISIRGVTGVDIVDSDGYTRYNLYDGIAKDDYVYLTRTYTSDSAVISGTPAITTLTKAAINSDATLTLIDGTRLNFDNTPVTKLTTMATDSTYDIGVLDSTLTVGGKYDLLMSKSGYVVALKEISASVSNNYLVVTDLSQGDAGFNGKVTSYSVQGLLPDGTSKWFNINLGSKTNLPSGLLKNDSAIVAAAGTADSTTYGEIIVGTTNAGTVTREGTGDNSATSNVPYLIKDHGWVSTALGNAVAATGYVQTNGNATFAKANAMALNKLMRYTLNDAGEITSLEDVTKVNADAKLTAIAGSAAGNKDFTSSLELRVTSGGASLALANADTTVFVQSTDTGKWSARKASNMAFTSKSIALLEGVRGDVYATYLTLSQATTGDISGATTDQVALVYGAPQTTVGSKSGEVVLSYKAFMDGKEVTLETKSATRSELFDADKSAKGLYTVTFEGGKLKTLTPVVDDGATNKLHRGIVVSGEGTRYIVNGVTYSANAISGLGANTPYTIKDNTPVYVIDNKASEATASKFAPMTASGMTFSIGNVGNILRSTPGTDLGDASYVVDIVTDENSTNKDVVAVVVYNVPNYGVGKTLSSGAQGGSAVTYGTGSAATFALTTANIANGTTVAFAAGNATGATMAAATVSGNSTTVTVTNGVATPAGAHTVTFTVDGLETTATYTIGKKAATITSVDPQIAAGTTATDSGTIAKIVVTMDDIGTLTAANVAIAKTAGTGAFTVGAITYTSGAYTIAVTGVGCTAATSDVVQVTITGTYTNYTTPAAASSSAIAA